MARCKNAGGGPGDEDPRPLPRLTAQEKGKVKKMITKKKQKFTDVEIERAAAVAAAVERAERGGPRSGVRIGDQLSLAQRAAVERIETSLGSPPRTVMLGEHVGRGGAGSGIHIGDQLSPAQRAAVERIEVSLGSPPGTVMLGGRCVSLEESQTQGKTK